MRVELHGGPGDGAKVEMDPSATIFIYVLQIGKKRWGDAQEYEKHAYEKQRKRIVEKRTSGTQSNPVTVENVRYQVRWVHSDRCAVCAKK